MSLGIEPVVALVPLAFVADNVTVTDRVRRMSVLSARPQKG